MQAAAYAAVVTNLVSAAAASVVASGREGDAIGAFVFGLASGPLELLRSFGLLSDETKASVSSNKKRYEGVQQRTLLLKLDIPPHAYSLRGLPPLQVAEDSF